MSLRTRFGVSLLAVIALAVSPMSAHASAVPPPAPGPIPVPYPNTNLLTNGDFETGDFTGWSQFITAGGTIGTPAVVSFDTNGDGSATNSAQLHVGQQSGSGYQGGGISQDISLDAATSSLHIWADIAASTAVNNSTDEAGLFDLLWDGIVVDSVDFGQLDAYGTERNLLYAQVSGTAGAHTVGIQITRNHTNDLGPYQYIDNVIAQVQVPEPPTLALLGLGIAGLGVSMCRRRTR